ncbi:MAG: hypothetical protein FJW40_00920 [Acidobacteria bacterium]|nr:hypothetical protein [Acidobacteriota bacterium]
MNRKLTVVLTGVAALGLAVGLAAQGEKKGAAKKGPGILSPDWKVEGGSYSAPMGKLGTGGEAWTNTTLGASINGKPVAGKVVTLVGEIVDFSCYLQVAKHGEKHRSCAQKCFTAGQPIGLLTEDGNLYMLMDEEHDLRRDGQTDFRKAGIEHAAHIMEVTGTLTSHAGMKALYVQGYLKK